MVTYFNRKDLVSFGSYLMSERRKASYIERSIEAQQEGREIPPAKERLKNVSHRDIQNWMNEQK